MRIRYDGPGHVLHGFGKIVQRGEHADFTDAEVRSLKAQPYLRITIPGEETLPVFTPERPSRNGSRRQWAAYAATKGITVDDLMGRDEIIAAVDGATA